jgi:hypothetical protein
MGTMTVTPVRCTAAGGLTPGIPALPDQQPPATSAADRPLRVILTAAVPFWLWLTIYNVMIAHTLLVGGLEVFRLAPPDARLLQHLMLFPLAIGAYRLAWQLGWPEQRRLVALLGHLALALAFASLSRFAMNISLVSLPPPWAQAERMDWAMMLAEWNWADWLIGDWAIFQRSTLEFFFNYLFGLALIVGLRVYLELRDEKLRGARLREDWLKARLDTLAGQLNPHFLFNSLHTVASFVRSDPDRAEKLVADLSQLLRASLRERERPYASLAEELEFIERYLQIERTRFEDRLVTSIDAEGPVLNARVPSLLLQPLVENAIKHGVSRARGAASIQLRVARDGERLILVVRNTFRPNDSEPSPAGEHIGLRNVRERLETLYGTDHDIVSGPLGEAWEVRVSIPFWDRSREENT